jgi:hypothetical protein
MGSVFTVVGAPADGPITTELGQGLGPSLKLREFPDWDGSAAYFNAVVANTS